MYNIYERLKTDRKALTLLEEEYLSKINITIESSSIDPYKWSAIGRIRELKGEMNEAESAYYRSLSTYYAHPDLWLEFAKFMYRSEKFQHAIPALIFVIEISPNQIEAYYYLEKILKSQNVGEMSLGSIQNKSFKGIDENLIKSFSILKDLMVLKITNEIEEHSEKMKEDTPLYSEIDYLLARYYYNILDHDNANKYLKNCLESDPDHSMALSLQSYYLFQEKKFLDCFNVVKRSLRRNLYNYQATNNLLNSKNELNDIDTIDSTFLYHLNRNPHNAGLLTNLMRFYSLKDKNEEVKIVIEKLLYYNPFQNFSYQIYPDIQFGNRRFQNSFYKGIFEQEKRNIIGLPEKYFLKQMYIWSYFKEWQVYCVNCRYKLKEHANSEIQNHTCIKDKKELESFKKIIELFKFEVYPSIDYLDYLPGYIVKDGHIVYLSLANVDLFEFPTEILDFQSIEYLSLFNTRIRSLPEEISILKELKFLSISNNNYLSSLPESLSTLESLREVRAISMGMDKELLEKSFNKNCKLEYF